MFGYLKIKKSPVYLAAKALNTKFILYIYILYTVYVVLFG